MNDKEYIALVFEQHCDQHHNADFEVCSHPQCAAAVALETIGYGEPSLSTAALFGDGVEWHQFPVREGLG